LVHPVQQGFEAIARRVGSAGAAKNSVGAMGIKTHNQMVIDMSRLKVLHFAGRDCRISPLPMARQAIALRRPLRCPFACARIR
jgi:hypothetical protein